MMACWQKFKPLLTNAGANIMLLGSGASYNATRGNPAYSASKGGILTLLKTLAEAWAREGIRVNGIAPGPTIKNKRQSNQHFKKQYLATPLKRQVDVKEICNAVDFLIKNSSITGQVIAVDSGQSLNWQTPDIINIKEWQKITLK